MNVTTFQQHTQISYRCHSTHSALNTALFPQRVCLLRFNSCCVDPGFQVGPKQSHQISQNGSSMDTGSSKLIFMQYGRTHFGNRNSNLHQIQEWIKIGVHKNPIITVDPKPEHV
jgi:hypothetical protein